MLRIIAEPGSLSSAQRKALTDFISSWPDADSELTHIPSFTVSPEDEDEVPSPESVFSTNVVSITQSLSSAPPAPAPAPVAVDVDKNGLPWDERIHASTHAKIADGSWKRKRGVDDAIIGAVEAQLRS